jgi:hypothetical protein
MHTPSPKMPSGVKPTGHEVREEGTAEGAVLLWKVYAACIRHPTCAKCKSVTRAPRSCEGGVWDTQRRRAACVKSCHHNGRGAARMPNQVLRSAAAAAAVAARPGAGEAHARLRRRTDILRAAAQKRAQQKRGEPPCRCNEPRGAASVRVEDNA